MAYLKKSVNWQNSSIGNLLKERMLILDGAMGTMIQHQHPVFPDGNDGNNDILVLSSPELIRNIHKAYVDAGADIICTNTFNANKISQQDYGTADRVYEINRQAARLARESGALYVAGSMGPTNRSASIPTRVEFPGEREVDFHTLVHAYRDQIRGLKDGGTDLFLLETVFDTLNAKAALFALEEEAPGMPVMLSATIADHSGRILSGQTIEAFLASTEHAGLFSVGLNCSFGPDKLLVYSRMLAQHTAVFTSAHPNAGLPDVYGNYTLTAEAMARHMRPFAEERLVNILGGCCGTTPEHIRALSSMVKETEKTYGLRVVQEEREPAKVLLSGLDVLEVRDKSVFLIAGERTNVAGSRKFARLIREKQYDQALEIARSMVQDGAHIIDINMDDALLDAPEAMKEFLYRLGADPEIARVPVMLDSSSWEVLETGLQCVQGKSVVNSLSLKEGEEAFLQKARLVRKYGAAVMVMAFDEEGQAVTFERRVEIAQRAFRLLTEEAGLKPRDIIMDPNVLAIATGMDEHRSFAADFIKAVQFLKDNLKGVLVSAGVSNLSFSFRGNETVREAMHAVFLYHAIKAGLDMAILKPGAQPIYSEIPQELRRAVEDVILDTDAQATTRLVEAASALKNKADSAERLTKETWRELGPEERLIYALMHGREQYLREDLEALPHIPAIDIVESTLMEGMHQVGKLFGEGQMFLPQVVKTARTMKQAVALLQPRIEEEKNRPETKVHDTEQVHGIMATVKGDVHDIGKNLVTLVMECNSYRITDLGVMVPSHRIVETAVEEKASFVGLSGLITPSLEEMTEVARAMQQAGLSVPLLIGGATTSALFTALRIAPLYDGPVIHCPDAAGVVPLLTDCFSKDEAVRERFLTTLRAEQEVLREAGTTSNRAKEYFTPEQARANKWISGVNWRMRKMCPHCGQRHGLDDFVPPFTGVRTVEVPFKNLRPYIKWTAFVKTWEIQDDKPQAQEAVKEAEALLDKLAAGGFGDVAYARAAVGFWPVFATADDRLLFYEDASCRNLLLDMPLERDLLKHKDDTANVCLTDFIVQEDQSGAPDYAGLFLLTASSEALDQAVADLKEQGDVYTGLLLQSLLDVLAEACSEYLHFEYVTLPCGAKRGIRPAFGYPSCPDHTLKKPVTTLLQKEEDLGISLTSSCMMKPAASVCGMYIGHPQAFYFTVHKPGIS